MSKEVMSLEDAKKIIKEFRPIYNRVNIYKQCYVFFYDDGTKMPKEGGVGSPQGVVKATGEIMSMPELVADGIAKWDEIEQEGVIVDLNE